MVHKDRVYGIIIPITGKIIGLRQLNRKGCLKVTNLLSEAELRLLFWDTDYTQIDFKKHSKAVIERILMFGSMDAYRWLFRFYETDEIKKVITTSRQLDVRTATMFMNFFGIPREEIACFKFKKTP